MAVNSRVGQFLAKLPNKVVRYRRVHHEYEPSDASKGCNFSCYFKLAYLS